MSTRHSVVQDITLHEVIIKRKPLLDHFTEGLNCLGLGKLIESFPLLFEPLFVSSGPVTAAQVIDIIDVPDKMDEEEEVAFQMLHTVLEECSEEGKNYYTIALWGQQSKPHTIAYRWSSGCLLECML